MEERRARMGLSPAAAKPGFAVAPAATGILDPATGRPVGANDPYFLEVNHELSDKGFFVGRGDEKTLVGQLVIDLEKIWVIGADRPAGSGIENAGRSRCDCKSWLCGSGAQSHSSAPFFHS